MSATLVTLAVLAGGEGRRMGRAKGLLEIGGRPILQYLLERWAWDGPTLLVTAPGREHPPGWEQFDREVADPVSDLGPLRGVLTALEHAVTPFVLLATVDMPRIERSQLQWLAAALADRPGALGVMLKRGEQVEPFPSAYCLGAAIVVRAHLRGSRRSVHGLLTDGSFEALAAPAEWESTTWVNLNWPQDMIDAGGGPEGGQ